MSMTVEEKMDDLERRVLALEARTRSSIWSKEGELIRMQEELVARYGKHVDKTATAKILGVSRATVYKMIEDGRINAVYGGKRVDVRSIARFISSPGTRKR
ncbi:MAG: helix-turn-helix domain-containing protein [Candidatus Ventricola sp.]